MKKKIILATLIITIFIIGMISVIKIENKPNEYVNIYALSDGNYEKREVDKSKKEKIIDCVSYSVYFYDIDDVKFKLAGIEINLKEALKNKEVYIEDIIEQAEKDTQEGKIYSTIAKDGGSKLYVYDDFSILKMNSISGNRDVYVGMPNMGMSGVE